MSVKRALAFPRRARADGDGAADRPPDREGDPRAADVPRRRRRRLPDARPRRGDALRRRGAAAAARDADRLAARRRALHPRRAVDRPAPARQRAPDRDARAAARPRQHGARRRARRGDDAALRLARRHGAGRGPARRRGRRGRAGGEGRAQPEVGDRAVPLAARATIAIPERRDDDRGTFRRARRVAAQPEGHRRRVPGRQVHLRHRRLRLRQVDARERDRLQGAREPAEPGAREAGRARRRRGHRRLRQGDRDRPEADRPHAALEPGDVHRSLHAHPRALLADARGEGARLQAGPLLVQRARRPLRDVQGRRPDQDRDALPARRLRPVRDVQGRALQPRDARGALQGQVDRRRARHVGRGGARSSSRRSRRSAGACRRCTTSGSTTSSSASRRRRSRAARRSA